MFAGGDSLRCLRLSAASRYFRRLNGSRPKITLNSSPAPVHGCFVRLTRRFLLSIRACRRRGVRRFKDSWKRGWGNSTWVRSKLYAILSVCFVVHDSPFIVLSVPAAEEALDVATPLVVSGASTPTAASSRAARGHGSPATQGRHGKPKGRHRSVAGRWWIGEMAGGKPKDGGGQTKGGGTGSPDRRDDLSQNGPSLV